MGEFTFTVDTNRQFWDANAADYQARQNARPLLALTRSFIRGRVLDAGAGDGSLLKEVRKLPAVDDAVGVDLAPKHADVQQGDLRRLDFPDGHFHTIFCCEVIEHLTPEDTSSVLEELRRVLSPGGYLIVTTPYAERLEEQEVSCPCCGTRFHRWGHQQSFREPDMAELARRCGLIACQTFPVRYGRLRKLAWLGSRFCRSAPVRAWMRASRGKKHLVMIARRPRAESAAEPLSNAA